MNPARYFFKKPYIVSCKPENNVVCHNLVTNINIETQGWGWLRIKAKTEPRWPGIKQFLSTSEKLLTTTVPQQRELQITMINCFGKTTLIIKPIKANSELHEIIAPQYSSYNKNLLNIIKPPKYSSFNRVQYTFKNATTNVQTSIQLSKQSLNIPKLSKLNLLNTPIYPLKPPFHYLNLDNNLKLNTIKISNKIDTIFIQND